MTAAQRLDPESGLVRGLRALVLTVPAVGGAVLAHGLTDGCGSLAAVLTAGGLCWPAAVVLLGARRRLPALIAFVLLAQLVTHALLERTCTDITSGQVGLLAHLRHGFTPQLVAIHLLAAAVTALLLGRADAGLWSARQLVRGGARILRLAGALPPLPLPPAVVRLVAVVSGIPLLRSTWETAQPVRRGPPAALAR